MTMRRPAIRERNAGMKSLAHFALAAFVALLGAQIGERSWRAPRAETVATGSSSLAFLPIPQPFTLPDIQTVITPSAPPSRPEATAPAASAVGPGAPFPPAPGSSAPAPGGFFAPRGPDYGGRPLPLPSPEQLRFLARQGLLEAPSRFAGPLRPDPLKIALGPSLPQPERIAGPTLPAGVPPRLRVPARSQVQIGPVAPDEAALSPTRTVAPGLVAAQGQLPPAAATPDPKPAAAAEPTASQPTPPSERENAGTTAGAAPQPGTPPPTQAPETGTPAPERKETTVATAAGESPKAEHAPASGPSAEPLRLRITVDAKPGAGRAPMALVSVTASAACHLALYRVAPSGRITPLLTLAGSGRMRPADSYSLAIKVARGAWDRLIALGSRTPLSTREAQLCLRAFLAEQGEGPTTGTREVSLAVALRALAPYLLGGPTGGGHRAEGVVAGAQRTGLGLGPPFLDTGRRAAAGPSDPPARTAWAIATASLRLPSLKPSTRTKADAPAPGQGS